MQKRPLRVGFDLDGVILYNPVRTLRPISHFISTLIFKKKQTSFYIPRTPFEKFMWYLLHKTSFIPARGLNDLKKLVDERRVEAYLITGRYSSLTHDFEKWMKKIKADKHFVAWMHNVKNKQPHHFKTDMIQKLKLDVFVEDNWDIVRNLASTRKGSNAKIFWITNFLDRNIHHAHKFPSLNAVIKKLEEMTTTT